MSEQINGLLMAYVVTAIAMLAGLLAMRADTRAYWRLPVYSAMVMVVGVVLWNVLRVRVFPAQWSLTHASALYYAALALYAVLGAGAGCGLGRLTRKRDMAIQTTNDNPPGPRPPPR
jgi:Na+/glutamate symporter